MAAPKLATEQQDRIIEMLATREPYADIAKAVGCSWANIDYYAKKYSEKIKTMREAHDARMIDRGLRSREKRIEKLAKFADRIERDLEDVMGEDGKLVRSGLWVKDIKLASTGTAVDVIVFAGEAIRQYRGLVEDIAKEQGERSNKTEITGKDGLPLVVEVDDVTGLSPEARAKRWANLVKGVLGNGNI